MKTSDLKSFNYLENGDVAFSLFDTIVVTKTLTPDVYNLSYEGYPSDKIKLSVLEDKEQHNIFNFPNKDKLDRIFSQFFNKEVKDKIYSLNLYHKLGIILHGKEGTGKSSILKYYFNSFVNEHKAIVFYVNCHHSYIMKVWEFIEQIRRIQKSPIVVVFEEFDQYREAESNLKIILDGNRSIDNCIFLATTNYLDKLAPAIVNRPSRFKYSFEIEGIQNSEAINNIVTNMIGDNYSKEEIDKYVKELDGKTMDNIKQFCLDRIMNIETVSTSKNKLGF